MEASTETVDYLDLRNLVNKMPKRTGGKPFLVPRLFIEKISNKWRKMKAKLEDYVGENPINKKIQAKEDKIDQKINDWEDYKKEAREELKTVISNKEDYSRQELNNVSAALSYSKNKIENLKQKKVRISQKGLGVFALSTLAIKKIASDKFHKIKEDVENKIVAPIKEEVDARKRAKEEDKVIKEHNKRKNEKPQANNDESLEIMKQVLEQLKLLNSNLQALGYNQENINTK